LTPGFNRFNFMRGRQYVCKRRFWHVVLSLSHFDATKINPIAFFRSFGIVSA